MENNLQVIDNEVPAIGDSTLIALAEQADKRVKALNTIKKAALMATNARDWTDQNGNPYLQVSGSEKVGRIFGISWKIDEPVFEQEESGHFSYTYKGYFTVAGATIEAIGTRSSKDGFFKRYTGKGDDRKELPPSEIDKGDLKKPLTQTASETESRAFWDCEISHGRTLRNLPESKKTRWAAWITKRTAKQKKETISPINRK